jgi:hypothetical protein
MYKNLLVVAFVFVALLFVSCNSIAPFPLDEPSRAVPADWVIGKWTNVATKKIKDGYFVITKSPIQKNHYHVVSFDKGKKKPTIETEIFLSKVANSYFVNVPDEDEKKQRTGYWFMRVLNTNADYSKITITKVQDTTMGALKSIEEVRAYVTKKVEQPEFYQDTTELKKLK